MNKPKHTPIPWIVTGTSRALVHTEGADQYGYRTLVARCETIPAGVPDEVQTANAEFIVLACNAHGVLMAALRDARRTLVNAISAGVDLPDFDPAGHVTIKAIDAAIFKAKGGPS